LSAESYRTIGKAGETEIIIQKSRFICRAKPVRTEEEANQFIQEITKKHWDATHNCYAYLITDLIQKSSDDGEPAGTAGRPILEVIHAKKLLYTAIVITRYFGGIKLGAGGLIRAYSQSASAAIEAAGIVNRLLHQKVSLTFDYSFMGKIEYELRQSGYRLDPPQFTDRVTWSVWVPVGKENAFISQVDNWTNGKTLIELQEKKYLDLPAE
jgi:uncharacterized YigZ family protein